MFFQAEYQTFFNSVLHGLTEHVLVFDFFVQKLNFYICFVLQKVTTETRIFLLGSVVLASTRCLAATSAAGT